MPTWLVLANGPIARFVAVVLALGLLRLAILSVWGMIAAVRRAGDRRIPFVPALRETVSWLFPVRRIHYTRRWYSYASYGFHVGLLMASLFLANHLDLLQANFGIHWVAIPRPGLDGLALLTIACGAYLLFQRIYVAGSRALSKPMDYLLLVLILDIFVSGFVAGRAWNPFPYDGLMLFHSLNGLLLLALIPFTKIAHCVLYPLIRLSGEIAWRFTPQGGSRTVETLYGPEGRRL
jgi:nitrate reductase gamma subunit